MTPEEKALDRAKKAAYQREWFARNAESNRAKRREYQRRWAAANVDKVREQGRKSSQRYYETNTEQCQERARAWKARNGEHITAYRKESYANNRDEHLQQVKEYYQEHADERREYARERTRVHGPAIRMRKRMSRHNAPEHTLWASAKRTAKKKDLPFTLEVEDIIIPAHCPVFGFELKRGDGKFCDTSPSIDKIVPSLGYVKGNIVIVSWRANRIKNDATIAELQQLAQFYSNLTPQ